MCSGISEFSEVTSEIDLAENMTENLTEFMYKLLLQ